MTDSRTSLYGVSVKASESYSIKAIADLLFFHATWVDEPKKQAKQRSVRRAIKVFHEHLAEGNRLTPPNFSGRGKP